MSGLFPNGTDGTTFDPKGVGALVFARAETNVTIQHGDVVDTNKVGLFPASINSVPADPSSVIWWGDQKSLVGSWMCLGVIHGAQFAVAESATLFLRVS